MVNFNRAKLIRTLAVILLATIVVTVFSKSSFLYITNDWADTNIYFSIGKALVNGQIMYTDIFDHKGTLMYLIYMIAAWLDQDSFIGVYLIEIISMSINGFLFLSIANRLRLNEKPSFVALFIFMFAMCGSRCFWYGGSAEELCFPCYLLGIDQLLRVIEENRFNSFLCGFAIGWIFWIKFTLAGFYIGFCIFVFIWLVHRNIRWQKIVRTIGLGICGFLSITLPLVVLMLVQGSLMDWLDTYIYANLFRYGSLQESFPSRLLSMVYSTLSYIRWNPWQAVWCFVTCFYFIVRKKWSVLLGLAALLAGTVFTIYWGNSLFYYGLPLFSFGSIGLLVFFNAVNTKNIIKYSKIGVAFSGALIPLFLSPTLISTFCYPDYVNLLNKYAHLINLDEKNNDVSILNYRAMDTGLENTAHTVPQVKYFFTSNIPESTFSLPYQEQDCYLKEGIVDYFITTRQDISEMLVDKYEIYSQDTIVIMDSEYIPREITYYLYRLRGAQV